MAAMIRMNDYRFDKNVGIARGQKNKVYQPLIDSGCDQLFLFDDDCWPIKPDWHIGHTWIHKEPHLYFTFDHLCNGGTKRQDKKYKIKNGHAYYPQKPCGPMLYIDKKGLLIVLEGWILTLANGGLNMSIIQTGYLMPDWHQRDIWT